MEAEELEAAAFKETIPVPDGLKDRIKASLAAETIIEESARKRSPLPYIAVAAAAAAAAVAAALAASAAVPVFTVISR